MFRQRSDSFERWWGITREYLIVPSLIFYIVGMWEQRGNPYLIFVLHFILPFVVFLVSLLCSCYLKYGVYIRYPVNQFKKQLLSLVLLGILDILFYKLFVQFLLFICQEYLVCDLFLNWMIIWRSSFGLRLVWDYFLLKAIL